MNDVFTCFTPSGAQYEAKSTMWRQGPVRGHFAAPLESSMHGLKGIDDKVFADLDGDRRPDAAVAGPYPVGSPSVVHTRLNRFTQSGAGAFALVSSSALSIDASRVVAGDVDGDGRNDTIAPGAEDRCVVLD